MRKTFLSFFALLCALAQETWAQTQVQNEDELAQAVKVNGALIYMKNDIELSQPIIIQGSNGNNVTVTIKMKGNKLTTKSSFGQTTANCAFVIPAGNVLNLSGGTIADANNTSGNNTIYTAGAIVNDGTATLSGITISGCKGLYGGAIKNNANATLNLTSCTLDGNEATANKNFTGSGNGGAIWNEGTVNLIDKVIIQNCKADCGAGIYNSASNNASGVVTMSNDNTETTFYNNKANVDGGAFYNLGSAAIAANTIFSTNYAAGVAGAIWNKGTLSLKGCDFKFNKAGNVAGIYNAPNPAEGCTDTIQGGSFASNVSNLHAGAILNTDNASTITVTNTTFSGNKANTNGGAVYCDGIMTFDHVTFSGNTAQNGDGGAIYISSRGDVTINNDENNGSVFDGNTSSANGGGIYADGKFTFKGVTANNNTANYGGLLYISENGNVAVGMNTSVTENKAKTKGGAIYDAGSLAVSGKIAIKQNTGANDAADNVFLTSGKVISVTGSINASNIGVCLADTTGVFTSGFKANNSDADPSKLFSSDFLQEFFGVTLSGNEASIALKSPIYVKEESTLRKALSMFNNFSIKLSDNIALSDILAIESNKTVTIDLGGFTLDRGLTSLYNGHGQVVVVAAGSTLNLSNGTLTGGFGGDGGGLENKGTATLTNVNITGNNANDRGGGISNIGTLTMTGGSITNNTSHDDDYQSSIGGGGIFTYAGSTTTLSGVTITGNQAKIVGGSGINNFGTLTLDGCTITGNTSKHNGGGVWTAVGSTLNMQGKNTVTGNTGKGVTENVFLPKDVVITATGALTGSQIAVTLEKEIGSFTSGYKKNNDSVAPATIFISDKDELFDVALSGDEASIIVRETIIVHNDAELREAVGFDGANIQVANDIQTGDVLSIVNNRTVTIDLNGKTLNRGLTSLASGHGQVFAVASGSTFNLSNGTITGGFGGDGGGLNNEGTATLTNVNITGNNANDRGGGISNIGTLTMTGGSITNNTSHDDYQSSIGGGGIFTYAGSTTTLSGVTITGNQAKIVGGSGINNFGTLTLDGCTITGNTSKHNGGGVWTAEGSTLNMQGKNTVTGNTGKGVTKNVYLSNGVVITVTGSLEGSIIGISMQTPDILTSGYSTHNQGVVPETYFESDDTDYEIALSNGECLLKNKMGTAIDSIDSDAKNLTDGPIYTLSGKMVRANSNGKLPRGIYIVNGKKVVCQ